MRAGTQRRTAVTAEAVEIPFDSNQLAKLVMLIEKGTISSSIGKKVLVELFENPRDPEEIIKENPMFIIDGAHNEDGAISLAKSIEKVFTFMELDSTSSLLKSTSLLSERATKTKFHPFFAKILAISFPTPPDAPVIRAHLLFSFKF